jgi:phage FluMu protein Com
MPATISCPECQKVLKTSLPAGKKVKCPECQTVFSVGESERPKTAVRSKNGAAVPKGGLPGRRSRDDDHAISEKPRRNRSSDDTPLPVPKSRRPRDDDDFDDEDFDDRPRRNKKKKEAQSNNLALGLIIGGVCLFLLGGGALAAFVWPGFLRSASKTDALAKADEPPPPNLLAYLPNKCNLVFALDLGALKDNKNTSAIVKDIETLLETKGMPEGKEALKDARKIVGGGDVDGGGIIAIWTRSAYSKEKMAAAFNAKLKKEGLYQTSRGLNYVGMPSDRVILLIEKVPDAEVDAVLKSDGKTSRVGGDVATQVRNLENHPVWGVFAIEGKAKQDLQRLKASDLALMPGMPFKGADQAVPAIKQAKSASMWLEFTKDSLKVNIGLTCATDTDARSVQTMLQDAVPQVKTAVGLLGLLLMQQQKGQYNAVLTAIADDLGKYLQVHAKGPTVSASLQLSSKTIDEMRKLTPTQNAGFPGGGPNPGGFQGMPGNFQGMPGNFQGMPAGFQGNNQGFPVPPGGFPKDFPKGFPVPPGGFPKDFPKGFPVPPGGFPKDFPKGFPTPPGGFPVPPGNNQGGFGGNFQGQIPKGFPVPPANAQGGFGGQGFPKPPPGVQVPPGGFPTPPPGVQVPPGGFPMPPQGFPVPPGGFPMPPRKQ